MGVLFWNTATPGAELIEAICYFLGLHYGEEDDHDSDDFAK
jgi:hypothetical protein